MKTTVLFAAVCTVVTCSFPLYAAGGATRQGEGQGMSIEQKKSEILQHIDKRIANSQAEKVCISAAKSHDELRACREKYRPQRPNDTRQGTAP